MGISGILGEHATYEGLEVAILNEGDGAYRVQIIDGAGGLASTCCGYSSSGIRERARELVYGYLLKRDGNASLPGRFAWEPIHIDIELDGGQVL